MGTMQSVVVRMPAVGAVKERARAAEQPEPFIKPLDQ